MKGISANKIETKQNHIYGLMRFGALTEDYWKAYNDYQNYLKELNNRFVYKDTDVIYVSERRDHEYS